MRRVRFLRRTARHFVVPVLLSLVLQATTATARTEPVRVESSDRGGLVLRVEPGAPDWVRVDHPQGDGALWRPSLAGFTNTGSPQRPAVPVRGGWIVVPPGTRPVVETLEAVWTTLDGRRLAPEPTPVLRPDAAGGDPWLGDELLLPGESPRSGEPALTPDELAAGKAFAGGGVQVGEPVAWRGRRIAPLTVRPLDVDGVGSARRLLESGRWRIRFVRDARLDAGTGRLMRGDVRLGALFLNGDLLRELPREAADAVGRRAADKRGTLLADEVRVPITRTGLTRLKATDLLGGGLLPAGVREDELRLVQRRYDAALDPPYREFEVPLHIEGDGGTFASGEALVFYGLRCRDDLGGGEVPPGDDPDETWNPGALDPVNNGNIYYLSASTPDAGESWARMESITLPAATGTAESFYRRTDLHEEDTHYIPKPSSALVDRYGWNASRDADFTRALDAVSPFAGGTPARIMTHVSGFGQTTRTYRVELVDDGGVATSLGVFNATNLGATFDSGLTVDPAVLAGADLRVVNNSFIFMVGYLDWYSLEYDAAYRAVEDRLQFNGGPGVGTRSLEVTGFTDGDLRLYEVSDPRAPRLVELAADNVVDAGGGQWALSLDVAQTAPGARSFEALAGEALDGLRTVPVFRMSRVDRGENPLDVGSTPDVVVVTHRDFREEADRWAAWRADSRPEGLTVHVVDVHRVYDLFGGGVKSPYALRRFTEYAMDQWGSWALQIFGDGNENARILGPLADQRDYVPSLHYRWQQSGYENEMLPVDKWYVHPEPGLNYPYDTTSVSGMLVGRFPANSDDEAAAMVDKTIAFEAAQGTWKRRTLMLADDAWSDGYDITGDEQAYSGGETAFENTQELASLDWDALTMAQAPHPGGLDFAAGRFYLSTYLEPLSPDHGLTRSRTAFSDLAESTALPDLFSRIAQSALLFHYQGHANDHLMAHEQILEDVPGSPSWRTDIANFDNTGKPFVFIGLGCHLARWSRDSSSESTPQSVPSISEKMLVKRNSGAVAAYASPGYEFLSPNAQLVELQFDVLTNRPPRGPSGRSRWILGEWLLAVEAEFLSTHVNDLRYRRAVAQYTLLGDALLNLDAAPPRADVLLGWEPLETGVELKAVDKANRLVLTVHAFDEAGVDRLEVEGVSGAVVTETPLEGATDDQRTTFRVELPVPTSDAEAVLHLYDTADRGPADDHFTFTLRLPTAVVLHLDGELYEPGVTPLPGSDAVFTGRLVTSAFLDEGVSLELQGRNVDLSAVTLERVDEHTIDLAFTADRTGSGEAVAILLIDGLGTEIPLEGGGTGGGDTITDIGAFPNPAAGATRFVIDTDLPPGPGRILVYTVAGHLAAVVDVRAADFGSGGAVVPWNGRDDRGDSLANGVYLYRVELTTAAGTVASGMQRLVWMR